MNLEVLEKSYLFRAFVAGSFFLSGLLVNFVQAVLFNTLAYVDIRLYRKINYYLTYTIWAQTVALADWWAGSKLTIYFADEESQKLMGSDHTMFLMNHHFELDWLVSWQTIDRYNLLGNAKSFAKKSLRFVPIIGFSWIFNEFAFLARSFEKDSKNIIDSLKKFISYERPVSFLFFPEGTRITPAKYEASVKFAQEHNLPILKHHLLPRTKGFKLCLQTFKENYPAALLCQIELMFSKDSAPANFSSVASRKKLNPHVYIRIIKMSDIPSDSEQAMDNYLYEFFKEKDALVEYHNEHDEFPGIKTESPAPKRSLYHWIGWLIFGGFFYSYLLVNLLLNGGWLAIGIVGFLFVAGFLSVHLMINSTKINKSSSDYGTKKNK